MNNFLDALADVIEHISDIVWPVFIPLLVIVGLYTSYRMIFRIVPKTTRPAKLNPRDIIAPASIALGAMVGTGALIGVLGSLSKQAEAGGIYIEGIALWAVFGAVVLIPLVYCETLVSKITGDKPRQYISNLLSPQLGTVYAISFVLLYVFGFGGFQFSGIDSAILIIIENVVETRISPLQRYLFVILPMIAIASLIVISRKQQLFLNAMTFLIGIALAGYLIFALVFVASTAAHVPVFLHRMWLGVIEPTSLILGVPIGLIAGIQRVIQTSEPGLGALAMAAAESDAEPRAAGIISLIPTTVTVFIAIILTSYITSYGLSQQLFSLPSSGVDRLIGFFYTAYDVTGFAGLSVLTVFVLFSGVTTLLGSYFFLDKLLQTGTTTNIIIYVVLILAAGTLAIFGLDVVFEALDLLMFVVTGINVLALAVFARNRWVRYQIKQADNLSNTD